ncbi:hypothetical protein ACGGZK_13505 [Agromyces sp. MMS24-K17]|uniref:hypothetical protein n=1 Tax=Agromyces sp. MMS24-K17 TaxID=3372850 RepID=UPI0037542F72
MRRNGRHRRVGRAAVAGIVALALGPAVVGCVGPTGPSAPPPPGAGEAGSPAPTGWPGELPEPDTAISVMPGQRGDCPIDPADDDLIVFTVSTGDDTTPVRVTYPVYRTDGQRMIRRMTAPGPVITVVVADCADAEPTSNWGFHADTDGEVALSCLATYRGVRIGSDTAAAGSAAGGGASVDCSGAAPD